MRARRLLIIAATSVLVLLLLAGVAFGALQLRPVQRWLVAHAAGDTVELGEVHGILPFDLRIDSLRVRDADGAWVELRDVAMAVSAPALLRGRVAVRNLSAAEVTVERLPVSRAEPAPPSVPEIPQLPRLPVDLLLDQLEIGVIRLAPPVLGEAVELRLSAAGSLLDARATARLALRRMDRGAGHLDLVLALTGQPARLSVALDLAEPSGALFERVTGQAAPVAMQMRGEGPLDAWKGRLAVSAGALAQADLDLGIAANGDYRLTARGALMLAPLLLPPQLAAAIGERVGIEARTSAGGDGRLQLDLALTAAALRAQLSASADRTHQRIAGTAAVSALDLAPLSEAAGKPLSGTGRLAISFDGPWSRPDLHLTAAGLGFGIAGESADYVQTDLQVTPDGDLGRPETHYRLAGSGRIDGLRRGWSGIAAAWGDGAAWRFAAESDGRGEHFDLRQLAIDMPGITVAAQGVVDGHGRSADGRATLEIADLAALSELAGRPLAGSGRVEIAARTGEDGVIAGDLRGAVTLPDGRVELAGDGRMTPQQEIAGKLTLNLPRLAALAPIAGMPLSGSIDVAAEFAGPLAAPEIKASIDAAGVVAAGMRLDRLHGQVVATADATAPHGRLNATLRAGGLEAMLGGDVAWRPAEQALEIARLQLVAAGGRIEGALRTMLDSGLTSGTLRGRLPDLKPWSALAGTPLAGRAELTATLGTRDGQTVDLALSGNDMKVAGAEVQRVAVRAKLADLLGRPRGSANVEVGRVAAAGAELNALTAELGAAGPGRFTFAAKTDGRYSQRFNIATSGDLTVGRGSETVRLTKLSGRLAGEALELRQPLTLSRKGAELSFDQLALTLGAGQVSGGGTLGAQRLALQLRGDKLPVGLAGKFAGRRDASGELSLALQLAGTRAQPEGKLTVRGSGLRLSPAHGAPVPALGVEAEADWHAGKVALQGRIAGPQGQAVTIAGNLPLQLAPASLTPVLPPQAPIALTARGEGELAQLQELLPIGEDRIAGHFAVDLRITGTVAAPDAAGALRLERGRYESMEMGTVLNDIVLNLTGDRQHLVLQEFRATDGDRGRLAARGKVDLAAQPGPALDAAVELQTLRLLRRDEAQVTMSGTLNLRGPLTGPKATAELRVDQGELRIPDRLPPRVADLKVVEIDSRIGKSTPQPVVPEPPPAAPFAVALDGSVAVPGRVFVRGRGLDVEARGKLAISGTSAAPSIVGALELVRGTVSVLDRQFKLSQGTIRFTGGAKLDPVLDLVAEADAGDVTGIVTVAGTALAPTIKLSARPELPQDEVMARILFGKSVAQITPAQGLRLGAAAASLAGGGPGVLDKVRSALGLDRFDFGSGSGSNATSASVTAGKYLSDSIYVGAEQGTSTGTSRGKLEIEIAPHISVETSVGMSGGNAIGLNWKMDY